MPTSIPIRKRAPGLPLTLLTTLLVILLIAGGASRADAVGQIVVRSAAWIALILVVLLGPSSKPLAPELRPISLFLAVAATIATVQLVPLPPALWQVLPGRGSLAEAAAASGMAQPWRPWSIVPGATLNALSSLIVPAAVLVLLSRLSAEDRRVMPALLLCLVIASTLMGLLQVSGASLDNPLINDTMGEVSGTFANRNHFALFLAAGCLLAPGWALQNDSKSRQRLVIALGLVVLFALTILITGSRAGLLLGTVAGGLGLMLASRNLGGPSRRYTRRAFVLVAIVAIAGLIAFVALSIVTDRALALQRAFSVDAAQDIRGRALPTVLAMIRLYFPAGTGLGSFDPIFRIHEPFDMLQLTYLNHAHNDLLEVILDTGIFGLLLLAAALIWAIWASASAWWPGVGIKRLRPQLGSGLLLLVLVASLFDYPARTPMMMAMIILAGAWLGEAQEHGRNLALPQSKHSV